MTNNRSTEIDQSLTVLRQVAKTTDTFLAKLSNSSETLTKKNSSTLYGTGAGLLGFLGGLGLAHLFGASLLLISTPLTALGIVGGVLLYRGRTEIRIERLIGRARMESDECLRRIKALPKNAPKDIVESEWNAYLDVSQRYRHLALELQEGSSSTRLLPVSIPQHGINEPETKRLLAKEISDQNKD